MSLEHGIQLETPAQCCTMEHPYWKLGGAGCIAAASSKLTLTL
jgi:hypothetical protein